jgi:hypothetical protein
MLTLVGDGYKQDINRNYVVYFKESYLLFFTCDSITPNKLVMEGSDLNDLGTVKIKRRVCCYLTSLFRSRLKY